MRHCYTILANWRDCMRNAKEHEARLQHCMRVFCGIWYSCQSCSLSTNTVVINTPHKSQESDFAAVPNICYLHKRPGQSIDYPEPHRISFMYLFVICYGNPEVRTDDTWKALCSVYGACRLDPYCFWLVIGLFTLTVCGMFLIGRTGGN